MCVWGGTDRKFVVVVVVVAVVVIVFVTGSFDHLQRSYFHWQQRFTQKNMCVHVR